MGAASQSVPDLKYSNKGLKGGSLVCEGQHSACQTGMLRLASHLLLFRGTHTHFHRPHTTEACNSSKYLYCACSRSTISKFSPSFSGKRLAINSDLIAP